VKLCDFIGGYQHLCLEDRCNMFFQNVGNHLQEYTELEPGRLQSIFLLQVENISAQDRLFLIHFPVFCACMHMCTYVYTHTHTHTHTCVGTFCDGHSNDFIDGS
jgi:hypothetical protein